jgi:hypothetical protein
MEESINLYDEYFKSHDELIWFNEKVTSDNTNINSVSESKIKRFFINLDLILTHRAKTKIIATIKKDYDIVNNNIIFRIF